MRFRPSPATLIALLALFVALGGPAEAQKRIKGMIHGKQIKKNTVAGKQVKNGSLTRRDMTSGTVNFLRRIPPGAIRSDQIASRSITGSKIADSSIGSAAVADKTLTAADIAAGSLTQGVLAGDTVGNAELADNAVGKANMRVASVGKSEMAKESIGTEELINGVQTTSDIAAFTGVLTPDLTVGPDACASVNQDVAPVKPATPERPAADLTKTLIVVGATAGVPDDIILSARPVDADTLRLQACNRGAAPFVSNAQGPGFTFAAFAVG